MVLRLLQLLPWIRFCSSSGLAGAVGLAPSILGVFGVWNPAKATLLQFEETPRYVVSKLIPSLGIWSFQAGVFDFHPSTGLVESRSPVPSVQGVFGVRLLDRG